MSIIDLKVDWPHVSPTMHGSKKITLRYDDEKNIRRGCTLRLMDPDEEVFALADVLATWDTTPEQFMSRRYPYYRDITLGELLDMMNCYCSDNITKYTRCKAISHRVKSRMAGYYESR